MFRHNLNANENLFPLFFRRGLNAESWTCIEQSSDVHVSLYDFRTNRPTDQPKETQWAMGIDTQTRHTYSYILNRPFDRTNVRSRNTDERYRWNYPCVYLVNSNTFSKQRPHTHTHMESGDGRVFCFKVNSRCRSAVSAVSGVTLSMFEWCKPMLDETLQFAQCRWPWCVSHTHTLTRLLCLVRVRQWGCRSTIFLVKVNDSDNANDCESNAAWK